MEPRVPALQMAGLIVGAVCADDHQRVRLRPEGADAPVVRHPIPERWALDISIIIVDLVYFSAF